MNLAFFTNEFPHPNVGKSGGIGTSIKNLAYAYVRAGHKVYVFVTHKTFDEFFDNGVHVIAVQKRYEKGGIVQVYKSAKEVEKTLNKYIEQYKIDFIEIQDWGGIAALMNLNCRKLIKFNGTDAYFCKLEGRKQSLKFYIFELFNMRKGDIYVFVSKFTSIETYKLFWLKKTKPSYVLPNAINPAIFVPENQQSEDTTKKILYLGTLIRKKGCLEIPAIFNEVLLQEPDARLILAGNDSFDIATGAKSTWEMMKSQFDRPDRVEYRGALPYSEVKKVIAECDICIYPSFAEALPMTWLEAMAMQKAIVTSDVGWAPEIVEDGSNGYMVNPKSHVSYAGRIVELLRKPELRTKFGVMARKTIEEKFNIDLIARRHIEIMSMFLSR